MGMQAFYPIVDVIGASLKYDRMTGNVLGQFTVDIPEFFGVTFKVVAHAIGNNCSAVVFSPGKDLNIAVVYHRKSEVYYLLVIDAAKLKTSQKIRTIFLSETLKMALGMVSDGVVALYKKRSKKEDWCEHTFKEMFSVI